MDGPSQRGGEPRLMMGIPDIGESRQVDLDLDDFDDDEDRESAELAVSGLIEIPAPGVSASGSIDVRSASEERVPIAPPRLKSVGHSDGASLETDIAAALDGPRRRGLWATAGLLVAVGTVAALWLSSREPRSEDAPERDEPALAPASSQTNGEAREEPEPPVELPAEEPESPTPAAAPPTSSQVPPAPVVGSPPSELEASTSHTSTTPDAAPLERRDEKRKAKRKRHSKRTPAHAEPRVRPASRLPHTPTAVPYPG